MSAATVSSKGQITIPLAVRQRLGLDTGDRVEFVETADGEFVLKPAIDDVRSLKGLLQKPARPVSVEDMRRVIRLRGAGK